MLGATIKIAVCGLYGARLLACNKYSLIT